MGSWEDRNSRPPEEKKKGLAASSRGGFAQKIAPQRVCDAAFGPFWAVASSHAVNISAPPPSEGETKKQ
jgi:hypothetical protein